MYFNLMYFVILIISLTNAQSLTNSLCDQHYPKGNHQQQCECEDKIANETPSIILKCHGYSYVPHFSPHIHYLSIEIESCSQELPIGDKTFADLNINTLRLRHCNLNGLNEKSFSKINHLEKFTIENSTINSLSTSTGNFQEVFNSDSFKTLKSLLLKDVHYQQINKHNKYLNLELLLNQLPNIHRLELINIHLDNYRDQNLTNFGQYLTYLNLINTRQHTLLPIDRLIALQSLLLHHLPHVFHNQPILSLIKNLKKLKYIQFTHNRLTNIDDLQSNTIDQIDLSSNLIEFIDEYTFEHVPKLGTLILTGNSLRHIDKNAFCGIENLRLIYLNNQKHNHIYPIDNCILSSHPKLNIKHDSQTKLQCNCQLMNIFQLIRQNPNRPINSLFKPDHVCIVTNNTLEQTKYQQQLMNHYHLPIHIYELENYLNCSSSDRCDRLCQDRKIKSTTISMIKVHKTDISIEGKNTSLSTSLYSFFSYILFLLLLAFLYL